LAADALAPGGRWGVPQWEGVSAGLPFPGAGGSVALKTGGGIDGAIAAISPTDTFSRDHHRIVVGLQTGVG
jgi:hypothetical protein